MELLRTEESNIAIKVASGAALVQSRGAVRYTRQFVTNAFVVKALDRYKCKAQSRQVRNRSLNAPKKVFARFEHKHRAPVSVGSMKARI